MKEKTDQTKVLMEQEQRLLDVETSTGSDIKKQKEWHLKNKKELELLESYSSNKTVIVEF